MPTTTTSAAMTVPSWVTTASTRAEPRKASTRVHAHADATLGVQRPKDSCDLRSEHPVEGSKLGVHHRDVASELASRRGDLGAEPPATDHDDAPRRRQGRSYAVGVDAITEIEDPRQVRAGGLQAAGLGTGGEEEAVVSDGFTGREHRSTALAVDADHHCSRAELDPVLGVEARRMHDRLLDVGFSPQIALRQRRPLVGRIVFGAHQDDPSVEAVRPQGLRSLGAREAGADDHTRAEAGHECPTFGRAANERRTPKAWNWKARANTRSRWPSKSRSGNNTSARTPPVTLPPLRDRESPSHLA